MSRGLAGMVALALLAGCAGHAAVRRDADPAPPPSPPVRVAVPVTPAPEAEPERGTPIGPGLWVSDLADGLWRFVAQDDPAKAEPIDANGLIVRVGPQAILVDPGWNGAQADALIEYTEHALRIPVRAVVVTHFHADRAGGLPRCLERGLRAVMLDSTAARLGVAGDTRVITFANATDFPASARRIVLDWPGAGHTRDNIVVWFPDVKVLYGGCLVKALDWPTLGNLADADTVMYATTIRALQRKYGDAVLVVPGHGDVGDVRLLQHNLELAEALAR